MSVTSMKQQEKSLQHEGADEDDSADGADLYLPPQYQCRCCGW